MTRFSAHAIIQALTKQDHFTKNMALECFLVHARNIRDFFASSGKPDDVLARDFLGRPIKVALPHLRSSQLRRRLNKRVAHLSYSRARLGRRFDIHVLYSEIDSAMRSFEQRLRLADRGLADLLAKVRPN